MSHNMVRYTLTALAILFLHSTLVAETPKDEFNPVQTGGDFA